MRMALSLADEAEPAGEVPVGAVLVLDGPSDRPRTQRPHRTHRSHRACRNPGAPRSLRRTGNYRLEGATLYTTLEPCVMCAGALVAARVERLVFGARDLRFGGVRSKFRLADAEVLNHRLVIEEGVFGAECAELMQRFFAGRRSKTIYAALPTGCGNRRCGGRRGITRHSRLFHSPRHQTAKAR